MPLPLIIAAPVVVGLTVKAIVGIVAAGAVGGGAIAGGAAYGIHRYRNQRNEETPETRLRQFRHTSHRRREAREQSMDETQASVTSASKSLLVESSSIQDDLQAEVKRLTAANGLLQQEIKRLTGIVDTFVKDSDNDKKLIDDLATKLQEKTKDLDKVTKDLVMSQEKLTKSESALAVALGDVEQLKFSLQATKKELDTSTMMIKHYTDKKEETAFIKEQLATYKARYEVASKELQTLTVKFIQYQQKSKETIKEYKAVIEELETGNEKKESATSSTAPTFFN